MPEQPTGTVTLLFSDIEGSTRLLQELGRDRYAEALELHRRLLREAFERHGGYEVDCEGDAFFVAFARAEEAVAAAAEAQRALAAAVWPDGRELRVRIGVHTGEPLPVPPKYVGLDVHRAARMMAAAHGGQVLLSQSTRDLLGEDAAIRDLGKHRLKDLAAPQPLYQLLVEGVPGDFLPPNTLENRPTNLPTQPTPLIGRERELADLKTVLGREGVRLTTVTGPGGGGKTRLALQVAAEMVDDYPDGVVLVALASIRDPKLVVPTIAQTLGVREQAGQDLLATLIERLREKRLLLVLDNFEQVGDAAPEVGILLAGATKAKVLATSRAPLRLSGEREFPLPPLKLPDPGDHPDVGTLSQYDAVTLFIERAQAVRPDFEVDSNNAAAVAEICAQLDGLPLAIELAAARIRILPPSVLLQRLDQRLTLLTGGARDLPERQRTLRGAIEWSHSLLTADEQALFARLAVFVGGCRLGAAVAVCDPDGTLGMDLLDGLESLVEKNLLRQREEADGEPRFSMLESIREYARERLEERDDADDVRRRCAGYFLAFVGETDALGGSASRLENLDREYTNLRAVIPWLPLVGADAELRFAVGMRGFWDRRAYIREGRAFLDDALESGADSSAPLREMVLASASSLAYQQGDYHSSRRYSEERLEAARTIGDAGLISSSLNSLALDLRAVGDYEAAVRLMDESIDWSRKDGSSDCLATALLNRADLALYEGDFPGAEALAREAQCQIDSSVHPLMGAQNLINLALALLHQERYQEAEDVVVRAIGTFAEHRFHEGITHGLDALGVVAVATGDFSRAAELLAVSEAMLAGLDIAREPFEGRIVANANHAIEANLSNEDLVGAVGAASTMSLDEATEYALGVRPVQAD